MDMTEIKLDSDIAQASASHPEGVVILLDHRAAELHGQGFGRLPRAEAGKLDLDPDPAHGALGERRQLKNA
jgi:hypothetical protein